MRLFRHSLLLRAVALLVGTGVLGGVAQAVRADPSPQYDDWLRRQAAGQAKALVDAALRRTILPPAPTPGEFLAGYAAAQHTVADAPTGALFGYDDLTFLQALGRLETRMAGLGAPTPDAAFAPAPLPVPATLHAGVALLPSRFARPAAFPRPAAPEAPAPMGQPLRLLHGVSAAQPMGP